MDYLARSPHAALVHELSVRERSVLRLVRACGADEAHARHVARLALELFDSAREAGFHELGDEERELLDYTALLHDVGTFVSYPDHHVHSAYLIANADLLGFDQREIARHGGHRACSTARPRPACATRPTHASTSSTSTDGAHAGQPAAPGRTPRPQPRGAVVRHARLAADGRRALKLAW